MDLFTPWLTGTGTNILLREQDQKLFTETGIKHFLQKRERETRIEKNRFRRTLPHTYIHSILPILFFTSQKSPCSFLSSCYTCAPWESSVPTKWVSSKIFRWLHHRMSWWQQHAMSVYVRCSPIHRCSHSIASLSMARVNSFRTTQYHLFIA
jgi:hypothetical protein